MGLSTIGLAGACGGKVAFDGLPSGGAGGHGGHVSTTVTTVTTTTTTTTTTGFGGSTGDVSPVTTAVTNVTVGVGGASGGTCVFTCAEAITDPCPTLCPNAPASVSADLGALEKCAVKSCFAECTTQESPIKCGDMACGSCLVKLCPMEVSNCAND